jgi:NAD(P)-dependent dehydrogenase (short-subunit alcohol dehydrogenase family)
MTGPAASRAPVPARLADELLEASVLGSFSRLGIELRARLLPEFAAARPPDLTGRRVIITGATSGIGLAAATELARRGAAVHFLARSRPRAERARSQIAAAAGSTAVSFGVADLENLDSVRRFAEEFTAGRDRLDVLIHNAGAIHSVYRAGAAGLELTVASQVLAPFELTRLLLPALRAPRPATAVPARVITVSSGGMYTQRLDPAALLEQPARYRGVRAYAQAKRAQVALSAEWARRVAAAEVAFHALHPGWVATPGIAAALPRFDWLLRPLLRTPEQGADTIVWLASADPAGLGSGGFWHDRRRRPTRRLPGTRDVTRDAAARLWDWLAAQAPDPPLRRAT